MITYTKREWDKLQYKDEWEDNAWNRSLVAANELPADYIGKRTVMVGGCKILTEGIHFIVRGA